MWQLKSNQLLADWNNQGERESMTSERSVSVSQSNSVCPRTHIHFKTSSSIMINNLYRITWYKGLVCAVLFFSALPIMIVWMNVLRSLSKHLIYFTLKWYCSWAAWNSSFENFLPINLLASYKVFIGLRSACSTALYPTSTPLSLKQTRHIYRLHIFSIFHTLGNLIKSERKILI